MKARDFDPSRLDVEAFAKAEARLDGVIPVAELERLATSVVAERAEADVAWSAQGEVRPVRAGAPQYWIHLDASASLMLECQRCLGPVRADVHAERSFLFVQGEEAAAELDAETEDDVLALTRSLDLRELIEDELLLALPLVPRHETCPQALPAQAGEIEDEPRENPFAALASLKRGGLPN